jgi:hypothetical protein
MTNQAAIFENVEANIRRRESRARRDETDRRRAMKMRGLRFLIVIALAVWMFVQLA